MSCARSDLGEFVASVVFLTGTGSCKESEKREQQYKSFALIENFNFFVSCT